MRVRTGAVIVALLGLSACTPGGGHPARSSATAPDPTGGAPSRPAPHSGLGIEALANCGNSPLECNSGTPRPGGRIRYAVGALGPGWNLDVPASNVLSTTQILDPIVPRVFVPRDDLALAPNPDLLVSAQQTKTDPQTLVYTIRPEAVWSDGVPIDVADFRYAWRAGASPDDADIASVTGSDRGKTVTVVLTRPRADWRSLFGPLYPAHLAARHGDDGTAAGLRASSRWFDEQVPTWSGGPFLIRHRTNDAVTEEPNPKWYGAAKPALRQLRFDVVADPATYPDALRDRDVDAFYSTAPDAQMVVAVNGTIQVRGYLGRGPAWERLSLDAHNGPLADRTLRTAVLVAIDRPALIAATVGRFVPGVQPLGSHFYVQGQSAYRDDITATGQGSGDRGRAEQLLKTAGYRGVGAALRAPNGAPVTLRCAAPPGGAELTDICALVRNQLSALGIDVRRADAAGSAELWVSVATVGPDVTGSAGQARGDAAAAALLARAQACADPNQAQALVDRADVALTADAVELPLFQQPTYLAIRSTIVNVRDNPTAIGPPYNTAQWGYGT